MQQKTREIYQKDFIDPIVFWGRLTNMLACIIAFVPAFFLILVHNAMPQMDKVISASITTVTIFAVFWIVEPISFFPIFGIPGTYMAFLSGNISNMRVPCSVVAQVSAGVEEGTMEGSVISVFGIGVSILINVVVMTIGAFAGAKIISMFPPIITSAFTYILPAVFGSVFGQFATRHLKMAAFSAVLACIVAYITAIPQYIALPFCVFTTVFVAIKVEGKKIG